MKVDLKKGSLAEVAPAAADVVRGDDSLPAWKEGPARQCVLRCVGPVTMEGSPFLVPVRDRVAAMDHGGALPGERPLPVRAYFARDRSNALASKNPEWENVNPFASLLQGGLRASPAAGEETLLEIFGASHAGTSTAEFGRIVGDWIDTARRPQADWLSAVLAADTPVDPDAAMLKPAQAHDVPPLEGLRNGFAPDPERCPRTAGHRRRAEA